MDGNNLAVCFAPTLCSSTDTTDLNDLSGVQRTIAVLKQMIENAEDLFSRTPGGLYKDYPDHSSLAKRRQATHTAAEAHGPNANTQPPPAPAEEPSLALALPTTEPGRDATTVGTEDAEDSLIALPMPTTEPGGEAPTGGTNEDLGIAEADNTFPTHTDSLFDRGTESGDVAV